MPINKLAEEMVEHAKERVKVFEVHGNELKQVTQALQQESNFIKNVGDIQKSDDFISSKTKTLLETIDDYLKWKNNSF